MKTLFEGKKLYAVMIVFLFISTLPALALGAGPATGHDAQGMALILNSYHPGYAWSDEEQAGIIDVFRGKDKNWLPVIEYLDLKRLPDGKHLAELKQLFSRKYQNQKFSVVIAMDNTALDFAIDNQAGLFRNAPIVFCGINNYTPSMLKGRSEVTGIVESIDIAGTIEVMLRLHPAAHEIFVPLDYTATGLALRKEIEALVPRFGAKVRFRFADPLTMEELLKELERLPKDSLVLEIGFITDKSYRTFGVTETTKLFYEHSPVPIYSTFEHRLGFGIVGGKLLGARHHGADAARIALRVLAGEKASSIPVDMESDARFMFDYKVMSRFGIPLSALPENSIVINKPVSFYAAHRAVIQTALGIIGILIMVISMLTVIIIQRRRSTIALRASEAKYYDLYENAPDMYLSVDVKTAIIIGCNNTLVNTIGYAKEEILGRSIFDMYHPDCKADIKRLFQQFATTGEIRDAELKIRRKDGSIIDVSLNTSAARDKDGKITHSRSICRDITERKQVEEKLRKSEEKYRRIVETTNEGISVTDSAFNITFVNPQFAHMFKRKPDSLIGRTLRQFTFDEDLPEYQERRKRRMQGISEQSERRFRLDDGSTLWAYVSVTPIMDDEGRFMGAFSMITDITERKRAEIRLARLNDCFLQFGVSPDDNINRLVAVCGELMNAACALYNRLGKNLLCSVGQWQPPAGFKSEDKPNGHICYDVIQHGGEHPLLVRNLQESPYARTDPNVLAYGLQTYLGMVVKWRQAAVGSLCVVYQTDITPSNDDLQFMMIIASAIAVEEDRRGAEEALRRAEENFRRSLDDSLLGVRIVTIHGETVYANRALLNIYGYDSIEELRTTPIKERYTPESYAEFRIRDEKRQRGEYDPFEYEISIVRKNGEVRRLQVFRKEILWNGERQFQTIYQDITERKRAEEFLKAALREKEVLFKEIHHRVKNNLQVISSLLDLESEHARGKESLDVLRATRNRVLAMSLIHEKLYLSHDISNILIDEYIESIVQHLYETYENFAANIRFKVNAEPITVSIDIAIPCGLIISELVSNAMKYAFPDNPAGDISIRFYKNEGAFVLSIADNGVGIPPDIEIDKTHTLGLKLVHMLVRQLKGTIEFEKTGGTCWTITF